MAESIKSSGEPGPFGGCPECGGEDGFLNVGREHWFVCARHRTKWFVGGNLFSGWRDEPEEAWQENASRLSGYREVLPITSRRPVVRKIPKPESEEERSE